MAGRCPRKFEPIPGSNTFSGLIFTIDGYTSKVLFSPNGITPTLHADFGARPEQILAMASSSRERIFITAANPLHRNVCQRAAHERTELPEIAAAQDVETAERSCPV